jgi:hypothetical protein
MRVSSRLGAVVLVGLLICAAAAVAKVGHPAGGRPDPGTKTWVQWPHDVSCENGLPFDPVAAFSGPTGAERGGLASERALAGVLASGELPRVRPHGWRRLAETAKVADFAAGHLFNKPGPSSVSELEWIELEKVGGSWQLGSFRANCLLGSIRDGTRATPWRLPPEEHLNRDTRGVTVELSPQVCNRAGGIRLAKPEFREQNGALLMTLWLRPERPRASEPSSPCPPRGKRVRVELPEKLGHRQLFDGGTYPPLPVAIVVAGAAD